MKLIAFIQRLFSKRKTQASLFSEALSEGIKDMFTEMGYRVNGEGKKQDFQSGQPCVGSRQIDRSVTNLQLFSKRSG